ncbi:MAG: aminotransferase class V-fold PLP-dependent enzyme [Deltaproteobacteria bacterium]|nr:aminotransferase class V-fold PLP-dependent enzyme [Candidatus Zymogenaceae bacterium]
MIRDKSPLSLSPEQMKSLGYRTVDIIVDHLTSLRQKAVSGKGTRAELDRIVREPLPETGMNPNEVLDFVEQRVLTEIMHLDHPRFFAFVPGPGGFVGAMADALASGFNVFASTWLEGPAAAEIELITIDWLREICGMPEGAAGLFVSGGSAANLTALTVARHELLGDDFHDGVVYLSDQTHSSVERALRVLGFVSAQMRKIPTDGRFRIITGRLSEEIERDRKNGKRPFCVVANAGTTNTGAVDPLRELSAITREEGMWLHVDGAYGAAAVLSKKGKALLEGLSTCDSLAIDPHKWLFCPFEIGCVIVREGSLLKETFHIMPEYLKDTERVKEAYNFCDYGIQLTRGFRALKLWMTLKIFGLNAIREAVSAGIENAETAERIIAGSSKWTVVTPAQLGIVTFRADVEGLPPDEIDELHRAVVERLINDGFAFLSSTVLLGRTVLRMCTINPDTTREDVRETIEHLDGILGELLK